MKDEWRERETDEEGNVERKGTTWKFIKWKMVLQMFFFFHLLFLVVYAIHLLFIVTGEQVSSCVSVLVFVGEVQVVQTQKLTTTMKKKEELEGGKLFPLRCHNYLCVFLFHFFIWRISLLPRSSWGRNVFVCCYANAHGHSDWTKKNVIKYCWRTNAAASNSTWNVDNECSNKTWTNEQQQKMSQSPSNDPSSTHHKSHKINSINEWSEWEWHEYTQIVLGEEEHFAVFSLHLFLVLRWKKCRFACLLFGAVPEEEEEEGEEREKIVIIYERKTWSKMIKENRLRKRRRMNYLWPCSMRSSWKQFSCWISFSLSRPFLTLNLMWFNASWFSLYCSLCVHVMRRPQN